MAVLNTVQTLGLPDGLIAAGFVRNLVWDKIFDTRTSLNDIDVIYFCPLDVSEARDRALEEQLRQVQPEKPWSVKNQARMHLKNQDQPYKSSLDAMRHWPEKQTAIGVRLDNHGQVIIKHCFALSLQFNRQIERNPKRSIEVFNGRIQSKGWLEQWPQLTISMPVMARVDK